jgi:hypothetical protein
MATLDDAVTALKDWLADNGPFTPGKINVRITMPNQNDAARLIGRETALRYGPPEAALMVATLLLIMHGYHPVKRFPAGIGQRYIDELRAVA